MSITNLSIGGGACCLSQLPPLLSSPEKKKIPAIRMNTKEKTAAQILPLFFIPLYSMKPPKPILLQTVKTQMKCSKMLHFIRVYTVCKDKKIFRQKKISFFGKLYPETIPRYVQWTMEVFCIKPESISKTRGPEGPEALT